MHLRNAVLEFTIFKVNLNVFLGDNLFVFSGIEYVKF